MLSNHKTRKWLIFAALTALCCLLLVGCFGSNTSQPEPSPSPAQTNMPGANDLTNSGENTTGQTDNGVNGMQNNNGTNNGTNNGMNNGTNSGMNNGANNAAGNGANGNNAAGGNGSGGFDWPNQASVVEGRIGMFSEIQESRIVVCEDTALVGVKFTNAYQGEMTQRIRDMVAGEVMNADNAVQVVAVTADPNDVQKIYQLSDQMRGGNTPSDLKQQVDSIARNTTTLR